MKDITRRLLAVIGFVIYAILMAPFFFPYIVIRGSEKGIEEIAKPLYYLIEQLN